MPRAVVFDLDYTLAIPRRDRATILSEAAAAAGAPELSRDNYLAAHRRNLTGETREPIFEELLTDRNSDVDPAELARLYRETIAADLEPLPGVEAMLTALRKTYRVGLLTNGPVVAQRDKLSTLGWEETFDASLVTGELAAGKPDARAFEAIAAELDVDPTDVIYVGDEVDADIHGATNAGMRAIRVLKPGGPDPDPRALAHIDQEEVATAIPQLLDSIDGRT